MGEEVDLFDILFVRCGAIGYVLWALSVGTIALIIKYFIDIRRVNVLPADVHGQVSQQFEGKQYREAIELTANEPSFLSYLVHASLAEATHGYPAMERAMEEAAEERTTRYLRQIEWLNVIGNISPMLGLMGTVWGMIMAFFTIVEKGGQPNPADLANDIGVALVTTLLGLAVAIPSLAVYAVMRNRIDSLSSEAIVASQELISSFRPGGKRG
jgi:biopolymer transport protein ExbB